MSSPSPLIPSIFLPPLPKTRYTLSPLPASLLLSHLHTLEQLLAPPVYGSPSGVSPLAEQGAGLDEFERAWCGTWLEGVLKRGEGWVEEVQGEQEEAERARVVEKASTVIALMAGCSAAGSLTRTFTFSTPVDPFAIHAPLVAPEAQPARPPSRSAIPNRFNLPLTPDLTRCSTPVPIPGTPTVGTPIVRPASGTATPLPELALPAADASEDEVATEPLEIKLHDAAMADHLDVGVLTWASSIFMSQAIASDPVGFFRLDDAAEVARAGEKGPRLLELGAGTGLLSIVSRKMLDRIGERRASGREKRDRRRSTDAQDREEGSHRYGTVVATDFLPSVLDNLQKCVDINFEDEKDEGSGEPPVQVLKLDWTTYPRMMAGKGQGQATIESEPIDATGEDLPTRIANARGRIGFTADGEDALDPVLVPPFDIILVADCVYDTTHAQLIKDSLEWSLRPPVLGEEGNVLQEGGVVHLLSPLRPTYTAESASIAAAFPLEADLAPLAERQRAMEASLSDASASNTLLSPTRRHGWEIATKHQRELERIKGMGRADEVEYTWWQIGWA